MDVTNHFEQYERKQKEEHFGHLIQVALADGKIDSSEKELLLLLGRKMGFNVAEINNQINSTKKKELAMYSELSKRFKQMFEIVKVVLADGKIDSSEMQLVTKMAIKLGFQDFEIPDLFTLLINGITNGEEEDDLFRVYRIKRNVI